MPIDDEAWALLAVRIPKPLHRELKLHCVTSYKTVMGFVIQAVTEKLKREPGGMGVRRRRRA